MAYRADLRYLGLTVTPPSLPVILKFRESEIIFRGGLVCVIFPRAKTVRGFMGFSSINFL